MKNQRQFTLIELLAVIGIIAILAGLAMPAVIGAYRNSVKTRAKEEMSSLRLACQYLIDQQGKLTASGGSSHITDYNTLISELSLATDKSGTEYSPTVNIRRIPLLDISKKKSGKSDSLFADPWGNDYEVYWDSDNDNKVEIEGFRNSGTIKKTGKVFIYSYGPDGKKGTNDDIASWD